MTEVEFQFDFGSPNAYMAHRAIPGVEARTGARFVYRPVLLGGLFKLTNNRPPMLAFADIPAKRAYMTHEMARFRRKHAIEKFRMNPHFPVNTLLAMRGAVAARRQGVLLPYVEAVMAAMWEDGLKMDDPAVFADALTAAGLDAEALVVGAADAEVKAELAAETDAAAAAGAFGSPTFRIGDELYFGKDQLYEIEAELREAA